MKINSYEVTLADGKVKKLYRFQVEAINIHTGRRAQRSRRGFESLPKAERAYMSLWKECREGNPSYLKNFGGLRLKYFEYIEESVRSEKNPDGFAKGWAASKKSRFSHLGHWDKLKISEFSISFVKKEMQKLTEKGVSQNQARHIHKEVHRIFEYAFEEQFLKTNPLRGMKVLRKVKRKKKALNQADASYFLREAEGRKHPFFFVWFIAIYVGLRRSEIDGLLWSDIDFDTGLVDVTKQLIPGEGPVDFTKGKADRTATIPKSALPIFKKFRMAAKAEKVVELEDKDWVSGQQSAVTKAFCRELGIKEVTFHNLRATFITLAATSGVSVGKVKKAVGHVKLSTTNEYFDDTAVDLIGATDSIDLGYPRDSESKKLDVVS